MSRPTPWVTDLRHYIDEETDDWVEDMPGPALKMALALKPPRECGGRQLITRSPASANACRNS